MQSGVVARSFGMSAGGGRWPLRGRRGRCPCARSWCCSHIVAWVVMCVIMAWVQAPGVGQQLAAPFVRGDVLVADFTAGFLTDDVGDLLL